MKTLTPRGFSLVELMVSLVMGSFLLIGAYQFISRNTRTTMETVKDSTFSRQQGMVKESLINYFDSIGYNPQAVPYAIAMVSASDTPKARRIGISSYYSSFISFASDVDRNGVAEDGTERSAIVWRDSGDQIIDFQSDPDQPPCTPSQGNGMPLSGTLYLETGIDGQPGFTKTPIVEKVRCFEIQYSCEVNVVVGDNGQDVAISQGEPGDERCVGPFSDQGDSRVARQKYKRWILNRSAIPGSGMDSNTYAVALPGNGSTAPHPMRDYYKFIRDKIRHVKVGLVMEGPCDPPQKELNPLTGNFCPTGRVDLERVLNPPWKAKYIAAPAGVQGADPTVTDQDPDYDETPLSYPNMSPGNAPSLPPDPPTGGDGNTIPPPGTSADQSGNRGNSSPILMMKTTLGGNTESNSSPI